MSDPLQYRRYRAPQNHGEALILPELTDAGSLLAQQPLAIEMLGRSLTALQTETRQRVLELAYQTTRQYRDIAVPSANLPIVMSGHQPQLFHPGVWFKNFVLSGLGERYRANAINLVIDNDLCRTPAIRIPSGTLDAPHTTSLAYDASSEPLPYEERHILDRSCLDSFADRTTQALTDLIPNPLIRQWWETTASLRQRATHVGTYLAQARHHLEGELGLRTWEIPLSQVCDTTGFHYFCATMLEDAARLQTIYNASLATYRAVNRVRSPLHPVPDLVTEGEWQEVPFWIWSEQNPQRRRLYARRTRTALHLTDLQQTELRLPAVSSEQIPTALRDVRDQGYKIRPRALMTTMFARLFLCETFIHGIGGGKYDQVTDAIIQRFFKIAPPPFTVVTTTWLLPLMPSSPDVRDLRTIDQTLRELRFHPEIHASSSPDVDDLVRQKRAWIAQDLPRGARLERHQQITALNEQLQTHVSDQHQVLQDEREQTARHVRHAHILASRETSFCAFPSESLCPGLLELARQAFYIDK